MHWYYLDIRVVMRVISEIVNLSNVDVVVTGGQMQQSTAVSLLEEDVGKLVTDTKLVGKILHVPAKINEQDHGLSHVTIACENNDEREAEMLS
jgi:hypothetical protein